jgi:hypothetical protein
MQNSNDITNGLLGQAARNIPTEGNKNNGREWLFGFAIAGLLLFIGSEAMKVIFRKNFGKAGLNIPMLVASSVCFLGIAVFSFLEYSAGNFNDSFGSSGSFLFTGIIYVLLSVVTLWKGLSGYAIASKNQNLSDYTGDSYLLIFLAKDGWNQSKIQYVAEPLLIIALGGFFCFFNLFCGLPLLFCGLSIWGRLPIEQFYLQNPTQKQINEQSTNQNQLRKNYVKSN